MSGINAIFCLEKDKELNPTIFIDRIKNFFKHSSGFEMDSFKTKKMGDYIEITILGPINPIIDLYNDNLTITLYPRNKLDHSCLIDLIRFLIKLLSHDLNVVICGEESNFTDYYSKQNDPNESFMNPFHDRKEILFYEFWLYYFSKKWLQKYGNKLIQNAPAWKIENLENGVLLINGPSPELNYYPHAKKLTEYFKNQLLR